MRADLLRSSAIGTSVGIAYVILSAGHFLIATAEGEACGDRFADDWRDRMDADFESMRAGGEWGPLSFFIDRPVEVCEMICEEIMLKATEMVRRGETATFAALFATAAKDRLRKRISEQLGDLAERFAAHAEALKQLQP